MLKKIKVKNINAEDNVYQATNGRHVKIRTKIISDESELNSSGIITVLCCSGSIVNKNGKAKLRAGKTKEDVQAAQKEGKNSPDFYLVSEPQTLTLMRSNEADYAPVKCMNIFIEQIVERVSLLENQDLQTNEFLTQLLQKD